MGRTSDARERLMDAAYELIWEYSYGAVTIDAICERAGVKKGSFYYFFDSKSDLAVAAIDAWWIERKAADRKDLRTRRCRRWIACGIISIWFPSASSVAFETSGQVLGCPLFTLGSEICTQDERIRARIHGIPDLDRANVQRAIADAQALGEVEGNGMPRSRRARCCPITKAF